MCSLTKAFVLLWAAMLSLAFTSQALVVRNVTRDGRAIQLDGFLLEWKKSEASYLPSDSHWVYDVVNTREGLTGYCATAGRSTCGLWKFRFLPHSLSPYAFMEMRACLDSLRPFYRTAPLPGVSGGIAAEWVIPWDSIWHDSAGNYQVGLFAFDTCGDSAQPLIFAGRVYRSRPAPWGGVYLKAIVLGSMMIALYYLQRRAKKRRTAERRKTMSGTNVPPSINT